MQFRFAYGLRSATERVPQSTSTQPPYPPHPTCWEHCVTLWLCRHDCFSCTAVPVFQAGGLGLTSRTTSPARTVRLILSNPELSSFDLKPPTRSYGKRSRPDRHQVATTRVVLHALVVLASSHEPVKKKSLDFWLKWSILNARPPEPESQKGAGKQFGEVREPA